MWFGKMERLSAKLLFWIVLLSSVFTLIVTAIQLYLDYKGAKEVLEDSLNEVQTTTMPAVAVAMWQFDKDVMQSLLEGLLSQPDIVYLEVTDNYTNPVIQLGSEQAENSLTRSYPVLFTNNLGEVLRIGELRVVATLTEIYRMLMDKVVVILFSQGIKTFFMSICILLLVERLVIRHLNTLAAWAHQENPEKPGKQLKLERATTRENDALDRVVSAINTMQSNLKSALDKQKKAEQLIHYIVEHSPSHIYAKDNHGRYTLANKTFLTSYGLQSDDILGHTDKELFGVDSASELQKHDDIIRRSQQAKTFDEQIDKDGKTEFYVSAKFPIFSDNGDVASVVGVSTNITERRYEEQKIMELNEKLEERVLNRTQELQTSLDNLQAAQTQLVESEKMSALGRLVAGIAHEINTPLGVGVTAITYLQDHIKDFRREYDSGQLQRSTLEKLLSKSEETVGIITHNLERAAELVSNFKQVAVDQSSEMQRKFELIGYLEQLSNSLIPELKKRGHSIEIHSQCPIELTSYPGAIAQIVTNLIMNSVQHGFKHLSGGVIAIEVGKKNDCAFITYKDNGSGLNDTQRLRIFEPFYTTERGKGGSGLGMSICYNLINSRLNGTIECVAAEQGAHFHITFPIPTDIKL